MGLQIAQSMSGDIQRVQKFNHGCACASASESIWPYLEGMTVNTGDLNFALSLNVPKLELSRP